MQSRNNNYSIKIYQIYLASLTKEFDYLGKKLSHSKKFSLLFYRKNNYEYIIKNQKLYLN